MTNSEKKICSFRFSRIGDWFDECVIKKWILQLPEPFDGPKAGEIIFNEVRGHYAARAHKADLFPDFEGIFTTIDQKSSALLTHLSLMIALSTFLAFTENIDEPFKSIGSLLLVLYVLVTILVLRIVRFWAFDFPDVKRNPAFREEDPMGWIMLSDDSSPKEKMRESFRREIFFRGKVYRICLNATTAITVFGLVAFLGSALLARVL